jgi:hypothetical protein
MGSGMIAIIVIAVLMLAGCEQKQDADSAVKEQIGRLASFQRVSAAQYTGDQCYAIVEEKSLWVWMKADHLRTYMDAFPADHYPNGIKSLGLLGSCKNSPDYWLSRGKVSGD